MDGKGSAAALQLTDLGDEELITLFREKQSLDAIKELILRYWPLAKSFVGGLAARVGLSRTDQEEAQANAVFGIIEAIVKFDPQKPISGNGSIRPFLLQVLHCRFGDLVKCQRRNARFCRLLSLESCHDSLERGPDPLRIWPSSAFESQKWEPCEALQKSELISRLYTELDKLDRLSRKLCEYKMAGKSIREFASQAPMNYDAAKRTWKNVKGRLRAQLGTAWM